MKRPRGNTMRWLLILYSYCVMHFILGLKRFVGSAFCPVSVEFLVLCISAISLEVALIVRSVLGWFSASFNFSVQPMANPAGLQDANNPRKPTTSKLYQLHGCVRVSVEAALFLVLGKPQNKPGLPFFLDSS